MAGDRLEPWAAPPSLTSTPEGAAGRISPAARRSGAVVPTASLPGTGGGPVPGFSRNVAAPWEVKPPNGEDFQRTGNLSGADSASTNPPAVVTGASFLVPDGSVGFIRSFDLQVNELLPTSDITFRWYIDGAAQPGWGDLAVIPATLAVWIKSYGPDETYLWLPPGKTADLRVEIDDADAYAVGVSFHGWTVPLATVESFKAGWG